MGEQIVFGAGERGHLFFLDYKICEPGFSLVGNAQRSVVFL